MNGFTIMANSYRNLMNEGTIDSSAFNDIIRAFLKMAVTNADIDEDAKGKVINQLRWIFDQKQAKEVLSNADDDKKIFEFVFSN